MDGGGSTSESGLRSTEANDGVAWLAETQGMPTIAPRVGFADTVNKAFRGGFPSLAELEQSHIENALQVTGGNKAEAARLLGISRVTLYRKLAAKRSETAKSAI